MVSQLRDRSRTSFRLVGFFVALAIALLLTAAGAQGPLLAQEEGTQPQDQKPYVPKKDEPPIFKPRALKDKEASPEQIIVKFEEGTGSSTRAEARRAAGLEKKKDLNLIDAEVDKVKGQSVERAIEALKRRPNVEYVEKDYINHPSGYADEPQFGQLWGLDNTGQSINGISGTADMDINGKEASAVTQGDQNLIVAVIDDGVDFTHPDLKDRAWKNPGESGSGKETNGVDDDANGKVDDVNGWDFYYKDKTVHDPGEDAHGTHVSGTLAASVNGEGVVGVAPNVKIMALKFLGPNGGYNSDAIDALGYAKSKGAKISNNSWGGGAFSQALKDAIEASNQLFVAAAGNGYGQDNDTYYEPLYPASYDSPNILSVAAVDNQGKLAYFSNWGATSVDVSAPGTSILSSIPSIPDIGAAALSSAGSSGGKAVTTGFGADEIGDSTKRASFFKKAFTAIGRTNEPVVLVDDDSDELGEGYPGYFLDVGPNLSAAIQSATGSAPEVIDVPFGSGGDGPNLSQLSGKTVVWSTGQAYASDHFSSSEMYYITKTTLTEADQTTLKNFLDGGGKLIITGSNALYLIENSSFVSSTLGLKVQSEVGTSVDATTFEGSSGTAFDGESYTFDGSSAYEPYHDKVEPAAGSAAVIQGSYPEVAPTWKPLDGTSMAAPHATGAAALAASVEPALLGNPGGLKNRVMNGKPLPATAGKTVTGDMVDALKAARPPTDTAAPTVSSVTPTEGAKDVNTTTNVVATFSEAMDAASVTASANFTLRKEKCVTTVPATLSYDSTNKKATLVPSAPLDASSTYTVTVGGAWDLAGNQLDQYPNTSGDQPKTSSFTTAAPPPDASSPNGWAWGGNGSGQLGDCTTTQRTTPVQVSNLSGITEVAGGNGYSLAVKDDGTAWAWGANQYGQLGDGTTLYPSGYRPTPVKVSGLSGVKDVAAASEHSLALKDDGTVWAWGMNWAGQLGDGTTTPSYPSGRPTPVKVSGLSGVTDVSSGSSYSLALKADGTVWAWGANGSGVLGDGTYTNRTAPVQVSGPNGVKLSGVTDVAAGSGHSLAVKGDGTVWAWGTNYYGRLGDGTSTDRLTPVKVSGLSGVTDVWAGSYHSLALKADGTVWAWGWNGYGQVGSSGEYVQTTPVQVSGISSVTDVSAGSYHSLALKDNGTVWTWGATDGSADRMIPRQVGGLSGITDVAGGWEHSLAVSSDTPPTADTQAPSPPTITSPQPNTYDTTGSFSVSGRAETASTVELFEGTTSKGTTKADSSSGAWSIPLSGVSDGAHTYSAKAKDVAGNTSSASTSVTVTVDKTAPKVSSVSPASGAGKVARNTPVTATFSEKMIPEVFSSTSTAVKLVKNGTTTPISAMVSYNVSTKTVTITPSSRLAANTKYTVKLSPGLVDLAGNELAPYTWSFTTGST
jgi:alpha-tubulin suppressor-like RCC1 family protein/subtilisin family serine protease